jgi:hypothetical protein
LEKIPPPGQEKVSADVIWGKKYERGEMLKKTEKMGKKKKMENKRKINRKQERIKAKGRNRSSKGEISFSERGAGRKI